MYEHYGKVNKFKLRDKPNIIQDFYVEVTNTKPGRTYRFVVLDNVSSLKAAYRHASLSSSN